MHARIAGQSTIYTGAVDVNIPIGMPSGNESSQAPIFFLEKAHGFCNKSIHDLDRFSQDMTVYLKTQFSQDFFFLIADTLTKFRRPPIRFGTLDICTCSERRMAGMLSISWESLELRLTRNVGNVFCFEKLCSAK